MPDKKVVEMETFPAQVVGIREKGKTGPIAVVVRVVASSGAILQETLLTASGAKKADPKPADPPAAKTEGENTTPK